MANDFIISLGGSLIVPYEIDVSFLKEFRKTVLAKPTSRFIIICGGGRIARLYQQAAKGISHPNDDALDSIGIAATRINAELVRGIFSEEAYEKVLQDPFEKVDFKRLLVCSGWKPGRSTDYVAVQMAKNYECPAVINMSNVNYVYDKDPNKHKGAKPYTKMTYEELKKIVGMDWKPGMNAPFDPVAAKLAWEEKKKIMIIGPDMANLQACLDEKSFKGTVIEG